MSKFLSRKFLLTLVATAISLMAALGVDNNTLQIGAYAGAILVNVIYILVEGKVDKAALTNTLKTVSDAVEQLAEPVQMDTTGSLVESTEQVETLAANQATTSTITVTPDLAEAIAKIAEAVKVK